MPERQDNGAAAAHSQKPVWLVDNLRVSEFLAQPSTPEPLALWAQVVGAESATTNIQGSGAQRVVTQEGAFIGARVRAEVRTDRIDWLLVPSPSDVPPGSRPTAGPYDDINTRFCGLCLDWLRLANIPVNRMAYGAQLTLETSERIPALATLAGLLPTVAVDIESTWDFDYSVNKRRDSQFIEGLIINRLSKWSLAREVVSQIHLAAALAEQQVITTKTSYLPMLVLDINTIPEHRDPLEHPVPLLQELIALGEEIVMKGDTS